MKPEAGEWPIPMRFSRDRAGSRQATGPKQLLTLRQPGSHPFAPSFRWDPSPRRKCESPPKLGWFLIPVLLMVKVVSIDKAPQPEVAEMLFD